jgi:hypothetical protein
MFSPQVLIINWNFLVETDPFSVLKTMFRNRYLFCNSVAVLCTLKCTFTKALEHSSVFTTANVFHTLAMRIRLAMEPKVTNLDGCHSIFHYTATNAGTFSTVSKSTYPNHRPPGLTVLEELGMDSVDDVNRRSCSCRLPPYQIIIPKCP